MWSVVEGLVSWDDKDRFCEDALCDFYATEDKFLVVSDDPGRLIEYTKVLSDNELEQTKTLVYRDESSKNYYINDSKFQSWKVARDTYNTSNSISKTIIQNEET